MLAAGRRIQKTEYETNNDNICGNSDSIDRWSTDCATYQVDWRH